MLYGWYFLKIFQSKFLIVIYFHVFLQKLAWTSCQVETLIFPNAIYFLWNISSLAFFEICLKPSVAPYIGKKMCLTLYIVMWNRKNQSASVWSSFWAGIFCHLRIIKRNKLRVKSLSSNSITSQKKLQVFFFSIWAQDFDIFKKYLKNRQKSLVETSKVIWRKNT